MPGTFVPVLPTLFMTAASGPPSSTIDAHSPEALKDWKKSNAMKSSIARRGVEAAP